MLTATYTLVALSVEQTRVRVSLQSLQHLLHTNFMHQTALSAAQVNFACDAVKRLYESCHWRKLDMFLIPAIRRATSEAGSLLQDLDELARAAADAVGVLAIKLGNAAVDSVNKVLQFCEVVESFCSATLRRLELEEQKLFPLARSIISGEAWFSIANQMLAHDAYVQETKPQRLFPEESHDQTRRQQVAANLAA